MGSASDVAAKLANKNLAKGINARDTYANAINQYTANAITHDGVVLSNGLKTDEFRKVGYNDGTINFGYATKTANGATKSFDLNLYKTAGSYAPTVGYNVTHNLSTEIMQTGANSNLNPLQKGLNGRYNPAVHNVVGSGYAQINAENGQSSAMYQRTDLHAGVNIGKGTANATVGISTVENDIIDVSGKSITAFASKDGIGVRAEIIKTVGERIGQTSNRMDTVKLGGTIGAYGPALNIIHTKVTDGYGKSNDYGAVGTFFLNPIAAGFALKQILFDGPTKIDHPRFEVARPNEGTRPKAHTDDMFVEGKAILHRDGNKELEELMLSIKNNLANGNGGKIQLEVGHYFDKYKENTHGKLESKYSKEELELNQLRQKVMEQAILEAAKKYDIPPEMLEVSVGQTPVDPNDKRLQIRDHNTNIKIISTTPTLSLRDDRWGQADFSGLRSSPASEQEFNKMLKSPEFESFVKKNKMESVERELVANYIFYQVATNKDAVTPKEMIDSLQKHIYDKGHKISEQMMQRSADDAIKETVNILGDSQLLRENLKKVHPELSESEIKKEVQAMSKYIVQKAYTDNHFQNVIIPKANEVYQQQGQVLNAGGVVGLGLGFYEQTFLKSGVLLSKLEDLTEDVEDRLKKIRKSSNEELGNDPVLIRMRTILNENTKSENKALLEKIMTDGIHNGNIVLLGDKKMDEFLSISFGPIDSGYYGKGLRLESVMTRTGDFLNEKTDNIDAQIKQSHFKKNYAEYAEAIYPSEKEMNALIQERPHLKEIGASYKTVTKDIENALKQLFPLLPKNAVLELFDDYDKKGKDMIKDQLPEFGGQVQTLYDAVMDHDVNPQVLREVFPSVFMVYVQMKIAEHELKTNPNSEQHKNAFETAKQQIEQVKQDPEIAKALTHTVEPIFNEKYKSLYFVNQDVNNYKHNVSSLYTIEWDNRLNNELQQSSNKYAFNSSVSDVVDQFNVKEQQEIKKEQERIQMDLAKEQQELEAQQKAAMAMIAIQETATEPQVQPEQPTVAQTQQVAHTVPAQEQPAQAVQQVAVQAPVVQQPSEVQVSDPSQQVVETAAPVQPAVVSNVEPAKNDTDKPMQNTSAFDDKTPVQPAVEAPKQVAEVEQTANSDIAIKNTSAFDDKAPVQPATQVEQPKVNTVADDNVNFAALGNAINAHEQAKAMMEVQEQQRLAMEKQAQLEQQKAAQNNHAF